jgi:hypothetical protein
MTNEQLKKEVLTRLTCLDLTLNYNAIEKMYNLPRGSIYKVMNGKQPMSDRVYTGIKGYLNFLRNVNNAPLDNLQLEIK